MFKLRITKHDDEHGHRQQPRTVVYGLYPARLTIIIVLTNNNTAVRRSKAAEVTTRAPNKVQTYISRRCQSSKNYVHREQMGPRWLLNVETVLGLNVM